MSTCNSCDWPAPGEGTQEPFRRIAAPMSRLRDDYVSKDEGSRDRHVGELKIVPFSLVCGNESLQGSKRGTISECNEGTRLHGPYGAYEAIDHDILDCLFRGPLKELRNRAWSPIGTGKVPA